MSNYDRRHQPPATPPQWQPAPVRYAQQAARPLPARRRPPYPSHVVRFPAGAFPRQRRRGRGHGIMFYVWLGSHPVLLLISLYVTACWLALLVGYAVLVIELWLVWCAVVTAVWCCQYAVAALRGR